METFSDLRNAADKSGNADLLAEVLGLYDEIRAIGDRLTRLRRGVA